VPSLAVEWVCRSIRIGQDATVRTGLQPVRETRVQSEVGRAVVSTGLTTASVAHRRQPLDVRTTRCSLSSQAMLSTVDGNAQLDDGWADLADTSMICAL